AVPNLQSRSGTVTKITFEGLVKAGQIKGLPDEPDGYDGLDWNNIQVAGARYIHENAVFLPGTNSVLAKAAAALFTTGASFSSHDPDSTFSLDTGFFAATKDSVIARFVAYLNGDPVGFQDLELNEAAQKIHFSTAFGHIDEVRVTFIGGT